jgi:DNA-binding transcriptional LysR family regulator
MSYAGFPKNEVGAMATPGFAETNAFVAVVEQKSFTKAAKQLGLSPPRVSEMVRNLEERLGVRLVERTTRSVAPTAAGERLIERLRPVLDEYQAAFEAANEFRSKPGGLLRLTVAPPAADFVLAPVIPRFLALYPEISLDISVDGALADIVAGRFDAGIRPGERVARDMIAVRVSDELPFVVAASPAYLARRGEPKTPHELAAHDCIRLRLPSGGFFPWRLRINRRIVEVHVEGPLIVNGSTIPLQAAIDGVGLVQLPLAYVAGELAAGRLVAVLDQWAPPPSEGFFLYYPSRRQTRAALKALVDFLRDARRAPPDRRSAISATPPSVRPLSL